MNKNAFIKTILTLVCFLAITTAFAQPAEVPGGGDNPGDPMEPVAPIGDYVLTMLVLGVATAYVLLRKKAAVQVS